LEEKSKKNALNMEPEALCWRAGGVIVEPGQFELIV